MKVSEKNTLRQYIGYVGVAGGFCLLVGLILGIIQSQFGTNSAILTIVGLLAILAYVLMDFKHIQAGFKKRSVKYGANVTVMILLVLGIVAFVEAISSRHNLQWDLTRNKRFTLSDQTQKVLKSLDKEVKAIAFYSIDQGGREPLENLLQQYRHISPKLSYEFVDPDKNPGRAKTYEIKQYGTIVLETADKQEKLTEQSEEALTNGLIKVMKEGKKVIYFLTGHGEHDMENVGEQGYSQVKTAIEDENYEVKSLLLMQADAVPQNAAVVVISGPQKGLLQTEMASLKAYLQQGGKVLMMLDPDQAPEMTIFLSEYGVRPGNDLVIDTMSRIFGASYDMPVASQYDTHPITENFNIATFFPLSRSIRLDEQLPAGITGQTLVSTGQQSWAETNRDELLEGKLEFNPDRDTQGPIPLAAVVNIQQATEDGEQTNARLVVFGDSDFADNAYLGLSGNSDLFLNTISWLAEEEELIAIRAKDPESEPLLLTAGQVRFVFFLSLIFLPCIVIVAGVSVFVHRKKSAR